MPKFQTCRQFYNIFHKLFLGTIYVFKGTVQQYTFSLKSGHNECIDIFFSLYIWDLKNKYKKKDKEIRFLLLCWPLKLCVPCFAGQSLHYSLILRGKVCIAPYFARQRVIKMDQE